MKTSTMYHQYIAAQYFEPGTAAEAALRLNAKWRTSFTAEFVEQVWDDEREGNVILRELGDRPAKGFPPSERLTLAKGLMAA